MPKRAEGVPKRAGRSEREDAGRGGSYPVNVNFVKILVAPESVNEPLL